MNWSCSQTTSTGAQSQTLVWFPYTRGTKKLFTPSLFNTHTAIMHDKLKWTAFMVGRNLVHCMDNTFKKNASADPY